jgi:hypothetical protein
MRRTLLRAFARSPVSVAKHCHLDIDMHQWDSRGRRQATLERSCTLPSVASSESAVLILPSARDLREGALLDRAFTRAAGAPLEQVRARE